VVEKIEERALTHSLLISKRIELQGIKVICSSAFSFSGVMDLEFGDKLETILNYMHSRTAMIMCSRLSAVELTG
jgi:hypothetical protein